MRTRRLGWTDLELTVIGLGSWAMGGGGWKYGWGPQEDEDSRRAIRRALDAGVNWIDTAAVYGLGHAEEVVGQVLKDLPHRNRPFVATKCGRVWDSSGAISGRLKRASVRAEAEASLRRLGLDAIDLYQIHWPDPDADIEEGWTAVVELIDEGKVRYGGVSNFSVAQLERIGKIGRVASLQPPYSMIRREVERELLGYCAQNNIGVVVYSPMQKGLLTGAFTRERVERLPSDDHRRNDKQFCEPLLGANLKLVEGLRKIASKSGRTPAQLAVAWVLRRSEVTSAIVGARRPSQIEEVLPAADWELSAEELRAVEGLIAERERAGR